MADRPRTKRERGYVQVPHIHHLRQLSHQRNQHRLKALQQESIPSTWDSVEKGLVGPVKDQGQCGSCWDFSGVCVVEVAFNLAGQGGGPNTMVLSEEYILSCTQNGGCGGDDNVTVLEWAKQTGLPLTAQYGQYNAGGGEPGECTWSPGMQLHKLTDWGFADAAGGDGVTPVQDIKRAIMKFGCVGCAIAADEEFERWGDNRPSLDRPFMGSGSMNIDHDVVLVGWTDVPTHPDGTIWKLRNSWGSSWGVDGYMMIASNANLVGTESVFGFVGQTAAPIAPPAVAPPQPAQAGAVGTGDLLLILTGTLAAAGGALSLQGQAVPAAQKREMTEQVRQTLRKRKPRTVGGPAWEALIAEVLADLARILPLLFGAAPQ